MPLRCYRPPRRRVTHPLANTFCTTCTTVWKTKFLIRTATPPWRYETLDTNSYTPSPTTPKPPGTSYMILLLAYKQLYCECMDVHVLLSGIPSTRSCQRVTIPLCGLYPAAPSTRHSQVCLHMIGSPHTFFYHLHYHVLRR